MDLDLDLGYGAGHMSFDVLFDNQYACFFFCHHWHSRRVISLVCLQAFELCLEIYCEIGNGNLAERTSFVVNEEVLTSGAELGCGMRWKESASSGVFWVNVSERYLKV